MGRKEGFKNNALRPSLKEDHVRHVPLLIVTLFFHSFFFFLPRTGSLRVITNHSQSSLSFSQLYINFFVKIYKISSWRGSKISPLYFSHSNYYVEKYPFQSRLPCSTSLTRFIEAVPSCWESFFLNRFIQMFLSVLVGTDAWNSCRDLCLNELYYPRTQRHFLVCPFSLFFFFSFTWFHISLASARVLSMFLRENLERCSLSPLLLKTLSSPCQLLLLLLEIVVHVSVISFKKPFFFFSFEENVLRLLRSQWMLL